MTSQPRILLMNWSRLERRSSVASPKLRRRHICQTSIWASRGLSNLRPCRGSNLAGTDFAGSTDLWGRKPEATNQAFRRAGSYDDVSKLPAAARQFSSQCATKTRSAFRGRRGETPSAARRHGPPTASPRRSVPDLRRCHQSPWTTAKRISLWAASNSLGLDPISWTPPAPWLAHWAAMNWGMQESESTQAAASITLIPKRYNVQVSGITPTASDPKVHLRLKGTRSQR